jgi:hypothetical protein
LAICAADEITISGLPLIQLNLAANCDCVISQGAAGQAGATPDSLALRAPMVEDGARGIAFVEAALNSHSEGGRWIEFQSEI